MRKLVLLILLVIAATTAFLQNEALYTTLVGDLSTRFLTLFEDQSILDSFHLESLPQDQFEAHIRMSPKTVVSITHGWMPYYHRHKNNQDIARVLKTLINKSAFKEAYLPFFAQLLNQHPKQQQIVEDQAASLNGRKKEIIDTILKETRQWQPADFSEPIQHDKIWAEYRVTGNTELITQYVNYLNPEEYQIDGATFTLIKQNLISEARHYYPVYQHLNLLKNRSSGEHQQSLHTIYTTIHNEIYQPSNNYWYTGDNHKQNKEYHKAMSAFRQGLMIAPDNPFLYRITGETFLLQDRFDEALATLNYARQICPDSIKVVLLYKMADIYLKDDNYHKAIELYREALLIEPENATTLTTLAWAYEEVHDAESAEKYYRESLRHKPSHSLKEYAIGFFTRNNIPPPELEESVEDLLMERKFDKLEQIFSKALVDRKVNENGILAVNAMFDEVAYDSDNYDSSFQRFIDAHTDWIAKRPESYVANACAGMFYLEYAWNARGKGYANTISKEGRKKFHERLRLAARYLTKAYTIDPGHSTVPTRMITVAKVHPDWHESEVERWFQNAVKANPSDCAPYISKNYYLSPKWGGSRQEQLEFARETIRNGPKDSMAPVIFSKIHWAIYYNNSDANYFKRTEVWSELKEVQTELIKRFPTSNERHNWFAKSACLAGDFGIAQQEFTTIGDDWIKGVWSTQAEFEYYKNLAFSAE